MTEAKFIVDSSGEAALELVEPGAAHVLHIVEYATWEEIRQERHEQVEIARVEVIKTVFHNNKTARRLLETASETTKRDAREKLASKMDTDNFEIVQKARKHVAPRETPHPRPENSRN